MRNFRESAAQNFPFKLSLPRDVRNAYRAYETSWQTDNLESEGNRKIYCELIDCDWKDELHRIISKTSAVASKTTADFDDDDENQQATKPLGGDKSKWWRKIDVKKLHQPQTLHSLALEHFAVNFNAGNVDGRIFCQDSIEFGMLANINVPLSESLLEIDVKRY